MAVRQRAGGKVTLKDMRESFSTGVDNTGNVCLWPAEEVMAHYILSRASDFVGKNVCELGAGVGLCGLAMARVLKANSLLLTDGNAQVVETLERALQVQLKQMRRRIQMCVCARAFYLSPLQCAADLPAPADFSLEKQNCLPSTTARSMTGWRRQTWRRGCWCGIVS